MYKINHHIRKLAINQEKIISKLQRLDKCVREMLGSHVTVNEGVSALSKDIDLLRKQKNENVIAIKELEKLIDQANAELKKGIASNVVLDLSDEVENSNSNEKKLRQEHVDVNCKKKKMKLPCSFCDEHFEKHSDLEVHLGIAHSKQKDIQCDTCGKRFLLHCRLEKHKTMHTSSSTIKHCHYYLAKKTCSFNELGCKFLHEISQETEIRGESERNLNANNSKQKNGEKITEAEGKQIYRDNSDKNSQCDACIVKQWNLQWQ